MESIFARVFTIVLSEVAALFPIVTSLSVAVTSFLLLCIGVRILANGVKALQLW